MNRHSIENCVVQRQQGHFGRSLLDKRPPVMQETRIVKSSARWFGFIIFLPATSASARWHFELDQLMLSIMCITIAGSVPTSSACKFLNQRCEPPGRLQPAHIWSMGAALMRARASIG